MVSMSVSFLLILFFVMLFTSILSGLLLLSPRIPISFIRWHMVILTLPPLVSLLALFNVSANDKIGLWNLDSLAWFLVCFVLTIGLVIQRFSVRYLLGDRSYRQYFPLFTIVTSAASVGWLSDDLRLLVACWGLTLIGLTLLISLNRGWKVTTAAAMLSGRLFAVSWLALLISILWLSHVTGQWSISLAMTGDHLARLTPWDRTGINLFVILAVIIPAAQWPFQRWLIQSVVAPTPISAIMHAGLVNAGGIILTRFSPLFDGNIAQVILLILSSLSVLIGTGISLVQVDYKRQLVGSTIAQMGFMLIQCALGAYLAAIIHLVLHGFFKAALFLQAGSAVNRHGASSPTNNKSSYLWILGGRALGLLSGIAFWMIVPGGSYHLVNAIIIGWSLSFSWTQLVAQGKGKTHRMAGISLLAGFSIVYSIIHHFFYDWLQAPVNHGAQLPLPVVIVVICLLLLGSTIGTIMSRYPSSATFAMLYLWLVNLGEGQSKAIESHPNYLKHYLIEGGFER